MSFAWIKTEAKRLSDLRRKQGWRPATVEPPSFPNRCMSVLAADGRMSALVRLLVLVYEIAPQELDEVAKLDGPIAYAANRPEDVSYEILRAWKEWRDGFVDDAGKHLANALVRCLGLAEEHHAPLWMAVEKIETLPKCVKGSKRHPDCW